MKLLFHCCCGPWAAACVDSLSAEGITPTLFWYNPNIHPSVEYKSRRDALFILAGAKNFELKMIDEYGLRSFLKEINNKTEASEQKLRERCELCYRMRLERTAAYAAEMGFNAFGTSLLISPYQQHDVIRRLGEELAAYYGLEFLYRDFRPLFRQGQNQARALGLYMQKYCGCIFSEEDASQKTPRAKLIPNLITQKREGAESNEPFADTPPSSAPQTENLIIENNNVINPLFQRLALLTGAETIKKLERTHVLVVGVGGVGSWCTEALVRSGVGKISIIDADTVCASNVNRQLQATSQTLGRAKVEVLKKRLLEINPRCEVNAWLKIFSRENAAEFGIEKADYVIDAIDTMNHKLDLIEISCAAGKKVFSSMGMARKMDPTRIKTVDIWKTHGCPLARLVREGLRKRGFNGNFTAVYSDEYPAGNNNGVKINGSVVTVTASAGMVLASLVLCDIMGANRDTNE